MRKCLYKKLEARTIRGICVKCNIKKQAAHGKNKNGEQLYKPIYTSCSNNRYNIINNQYRDLYKQFKKMFVKNAVLYLNINVNLIVII